MVIRRRRLLLVLGGTVAAAGLGLTIWLMRSHQSQMVLSAGLSLKSEWQEVRPTGEMRTTAEWSELLVEVPNLRAGGPGNRVLLAEGTGVHVEGLLTAVGGERINLDRVGVVEYDAKSFVRLSSGLLEWRRRDYNVVSVALRSDMPIQTGKVIWMSYDPRATKSGVAFPRNLQ